jgi:choline dehydrogenase-like flavoprotein
MDSPGFGVGFKKAVRGNTRWRANIGLFAECLARRENYVELDPENTDAWGIPTLKIHMDWSDNEKKLWNDGREQGAAMLEAAGAKDIELTGDGYSVPGFCIHEVGTARMGNDPKTSVLNSFSQTHEVKNLFVTDGAGWVSSGCQNPTLTMMAITARTCEYIVDQHRKGELA